MTRRVLLVFLLVFGASAPAAAATVIDGDTLVVDGVRVRLAGIDAFEAAQTCGAPPWPCGRAARAALRALVEGQRVRCSILGEDRYARSLGVCRAGGQDLGAALVAAGLAVAYRRYSLRYAPEEIAARAAGRGAWAGAFTAPEAWRRRSVAGPAE